MVQSDRRIKKHLVEQFESVGDDKPVSSEHVAACLDMSTATLAKWRLEQPNLLPWVNVDLIHGTMTLDNTKNSDDLHIAWVMCLLPCSGIAPNSLTARVGYFLRVLLSAMIMSQILVNSMRISLNWLA